VFEMIVLPAAMLVIGGVLLWWGGDKLVDHAAHLARSFRVPKHVVGAVVLGFGTSLPELLVCVMAAHSGEPGIAIGNVVGSNIANVGLILGVAAVLAPVVVEPKLIRLDLPTALLASVGVAVVFYPDGGELSRLAGVGFLAVFAVYIALSLMAARAHRKATRDDEVKDRHPWKDALWILLGLALVGGGARLFVDGATGLALAFGVPSEVIGLSLVALGTSLPELVTTVQAAKQGHPELAIGNVAGSNVFNLFLVLGTTGAILPIPVSSAMAKDAILMVAFAILAFPVFGRGVRIPRGHGVLLLLGYVSYITWLFVSGRVPE
jgi:cation:H+ antiporter